MKLTAYLGRRTRRLIVWLVATAVVVAIVLAYQLNLAANEEDKGEGQSDAPAPAACAANPSLPGCPPPGAAQDD